MTVNLREIARIDLNLLLVFQAILNEGSVTRAAQRLGRSQSSTSEALSRLRESLNDPLFWRSGGRMIPSPRARQLEPVVRSIVHNAGRLAATPQVFDPREAGGEVRLCMTEYGSTLILPNLYDVISKSAPNVRLKSATAFRYSIEDGLRNSSYDLAIGVFGLTSADFQSTNLFSEPFVCLTDKKHPALEHVTNDVLRAADLQSYPHIKVAVYRERNSLIDDILVKAGIEISDTITVGQFLVAPQLLHDRQLMFLCGRHFANAVASQFDLKITKIPWELPEISIRAAWHRRTNDDALLGWIKSEIENISRKYQT